MSRFIANRTLTSLSAIYKHYNATTKSEKQSAIDRAYGSLNRSAKGRVVKAKIENRRAASRKAAVTRREKKEQERTRYREDLASFHGYDIEEYENRYPDVPTRTDRNYSAKHAYLVRLEWLSTTVTANGPSHHTHYTMTTYLSNHPMTIGEIDRAVWDDFSGSMVGGPMGDSDSGDDELTGWEIVAHYVSSTKGRKTHAA